MTPLIDAQELEIDGFDDQNAYLKSLTGKGKGLIGKVSYRL